MTERQLNIGALLITIALIGIVLCGCAGWQTTSARIVLGIEGTGKATQAFVKQQCSPAKLKPAVDECVRKKDAKCPALIRCEVAHKVLHSLFTAVLVAKLAIQAGDEAKASAAVGAVLQAIPPVMAAVKEWKQ